MVSRDTFTAKVPKNLFEDESFHRWEKELDGSQLIRVEATKEIIKSNGLITNVKRLEGGLYEKKWKIGLRLYFAIIEDNENEKTLLLLGSGKGREQRKTILKIKQILLRYNVVINDIRYKEGRI